MGQVTLGRYWVGTAIIRLHSMLRIGPAWNRRLFVAAILLRFCADSFDICWWASKRVTKCKTFWLFISSSQMMGNEQWKGRGKIQLRWDKGENIKDKFRDRRRNEMYSRRIYSELYHLDQWINRHFVYQSILN